MGLRTKDRPCTRIKYYALGEHIHMIAKQRACCVILVGDNSMYSHIWIGVEFFKREIEALERRAKAADDARVETEARLARIAAALRG